MSKMEGKTTNFSRRLKWLDLTDPDPPPPPYFTTALRHCPGCTGVYVSAGTGGQVFPDGARSQPVLAGAVAMVASRVVRHQEPADGDGR